MDYLARQKRFAAACSERKLEAFLVLHRPNIRYLCGFTGSAGVLAYCGGKMTLFTDGRYTEQAKDEVRHTRVVIAKGAALEGAAESIAKRGTRIGVESEHMTLAMGKRLGKSLAATRTRMVGQVGTVEKLRMQKDEKELALMAAAVQLGSRLFATAIEAVRPGVMEAEIAAEIEYAARRAGAEGMSFETIVAAGAHSALPHWRASAQRVPGSGFVVLDFGVILSGYCSDMTRTVWVGKPNSKARDMYAAVLEAQSAGIEAVRPGVAAGSVDLAVRRVLKRAGLAKYFTHSTGHGVGLEIHEAPRLARGQPELLQPGMVVTVEPGVYVPGKGGVRIEDVVAVTESSHEVLTPTTKQFIAV